MYLATFLHRFHLLEKLELTKKNSQAHQVRWFDQRHVITEKGKVLWKTKEVFEKQK